MYWNWEGRWDEIFQYRNDDDLAFKVDLSHPFPFCPCQSMEILKGEMISKKLQMSESGRGEDRLVRSIHLGISGMEDQHALPDQ